MNSSIDCRSLFVIHAVWNNLRALPKVRPASQPPHDLEPAYVFGHFSTLVKLSLCRSSLPHLHAAKHILSRLRVAKKARNSVRYAKIQPSLVFPFVIALSTLLSCLSHGYAQIHTDHSVSAVSFHIFQAVAKGPILSGKIGDAWVSSSSSSRRVRW